jgi:carboxyl-terminal processing protease
VQSQSKIEGLWRSRGYGWALRIDPDGYAMAHLSQGYCVLAEQGSRALFERSFDRVDVQDDRLTLHQAGDLTRYEFRRLVEAPDVRIMRPGSVLDAAVNFEALWQTFDEHYAFFDLHRVDWRALHREQRMRVTPNMTDAELIRVFRDLLLPLEDGHVSLSGAGQSVQTLKAIDVREAVRAAFGMPTPRVSPRATVDAISPRIADVLLAPFANTRSPLQQACNGIVSWCRLTPRVGYLSVLRLFGFADSDAARAANDLPHGRPEVAAFLDRDLEALEVALDRVFTELADCEAMIVDLRINGGGFDRAGLAIANRFADRSRLAFTKCARAGDAFTDPQEIHVQPAGRPGFLKTTKVLISPLCVSAGEICVLALRALPHVTTLGQNTAGMLSDNLNKVLPNGWTYSLSNEIYTAADGRCYEGVGIAPDEPLIVMDPARLVESMQESLEQTVILSGAKNLA